MILQIIIATVVAGLATGRYWWGKFLNLIKFKNADGDHIVKSEEQKSKDKKQ